MAAAALAESAESPAALAAAEAELGAAVAVEAAVAALAVSYQLESPKASSPRAARTAWTVGFLPAGVVRPVVRDGSAALQALPAEWFRGLAAEDAAAEAPAFPVEFPAPQAWEASQGWLHSAPPDVPALPAGYRVFLAEEFPVLPVFYVHPVLRQVWRDVPVSAAEYRGPRVGSPQVRSVLLVGSPRALPVWGAGLELSRQALPALAAVRVLSRLV